MTTPHHNHTTYLGEANLPPQCTHLGSPLTEPDYGEGVEKVKGHTELPPPLINGAHEQSTGQHQ